MADMDARQAIAWLKADYQTTIRQTHRAVAFAAAIAALEPHVPKRYVAANGGVYECGRRMSSTEIAAQLNARNESDGRRGE